MVPIFLDEASGLQFPRSSKSDDNRPVPAKIVRLYHSNGEWGVLFHLNANMKNPKGSK